MFFACQGDICSSIGAAAQINESTATILIGFALSVLGATVSHMQKERQLPRSTTAVFRRWPATEPCGTDSSIACL